MAIVHNTYEKELYNEDGNIVGREVTIESTNIHKNEEGEFFKIYTKGLNNLPEALTLAAFKCLMQLANYASYADINDLEGGMLVQLSTTVREEIQEKLNIKKRTFYDNLKNLVECDLIRKIKNDCYQLNPNLLGKGYFEYKATYKQGGIKDLREKWNNGLQQQEIRVGDNRHTKSYILTEIANLDDKIDNSTNYYEKQSYISEKNTWLQELKKLSDTEYTKSVEYTIKQNEELKKLEASLPPEEEEDPINPFQDIASDLFDMP